MRELTSFPEKTHAERLAGYLVTQGIPASPDREDDRWVVWIINDDDRDSARKILDEFCLNPDAERYSGAVSRARKLEQQEIEKNKQLRRQQVDVAKRWSGHWWYSYPATACLIGISIIVAAVCTDWNNIQPGGFLGLPGLCTNRQSPVLRALFIADPAQPGSSLLSSIFRGEFWRPVTPIFLHFDVLHLLFNMMWMRQLATGVEFLRGTRRFLLLVLILAVTSNVAQYYWSGPMFGGMSGVVFGIIGYVWMKGITQPEQGLGLSPNLIVWAVFWLFLCMSGRMGGIANAAHLVGLVVGIALGAGGVLWKSAVRALRNTISD